MPVIEKPKRRYIDESTRFEGVHRRHSLNCNKALDRASRCNCSPVYYGTVWDNEAGKNLRTDRVGDILVAKNLRADLWAAVHSRERRQADRVDSHRTPYGMPTPTPLARGRGRTRLKDAQPEFIEDCRKGVALNKLGRQYTNNAITDLDSSLNRLPQWLRGKFLDAIEDPDLQAVIDELRREQLSSSRINSVINSVRSLSRWAKLRGKVPSLLGVDVNLPADDSTPRDRIATPGEFAYLLDQLDGPDALPWALAAYATARSQEIETLEWPEVDFEHDVLLLAADDNARKSEAARRIVPMVRQLRDRLHAEWVRQGEPRTGRVCPARAKSKSGKLSLNNLQKRRMPRWEDLDLQPIGLQDSRHTAATWLDHAHVSPKVASVFMGHKAPKRQVDAAPITLKRYTHVLPRELERARDQLQAFLDEREAEEVGTDFTLEARRLHPGAPTCILPRQAV
jgi:integrase